MKNLFLIALAIFVVLGLSYKLYDKGYDKGYAIGLDHGYDDGQLDAYDDAYNEGYEKGYDDGYGIGYEAPRLHVCEDFLKLFAFRMAITELLYDKEYDIVRTLMEYNLEGVAEALEEEFRTKDLAVIIDRIEGLPYTIDGDCEICGDPVFTNEVTLLPYGIECAHQACIANN